MEEERTAFGTAEPALTKNEGSIEVEGGMNSLGEESVRIVESPVRFKELSIKTIAIASSNPRIAGCNSN